MGSHSGQLHALGEREPSGYASSNLAPTAGVVSSNFLRAVVVE